MKKKLKSIQEYFVAKLVKEDYVVKEVHSHYTDVVVDGEFPFRIWTANDAYGLSLYEAGSTLGDMINCVYLTFTEEQKTAIYEQLCRATCAARKKEAQKRLNQAKIDLKKIDC